MRSRHCGKNIAYAYIALYALIVFVYARVPMSMIDDFVFFDSYTNGESVYGFAPDEGRFFPAAYLDLALISKFGSSPYLFFGFNAICLITCLHFMYSNIMRVQSSHVTALALLIAISLNPGFALAITNICYPEKMQFLAIALCFHFLLNVLDHVRREHDQSNASRFNAHISTTSVSPSSPYTGGGGGLRSLSVSNIVLCALFANYAIYLKEPTFIFFGVLSVMILFLRRSRGLDSLNVLGIVLLISSVVFIALYMVVVYPQIESAYNSTFLRDAKSSVLIITIRRALEQLIQNSFVLLGIAIAMIACLYAKKNAHLLRDDKHIVVMSIGAAAIFTLCGFLGAKAIDRFYYLSTMYYYFALPVALYFNTNRLTRIMTMAECCVYFASSSIYAMHVLTINKSYVVSHQDTAEFLRGYFNDHKDKTVSVFFEGQSKSIHHRPMLKWVRFLGKGNYIIESFPPPPHHHRQSITTEKYHS